MRSRLLFGEHFEDMINHDYVGEGSFWVICDNTDHFSFVSNCCKVKVEMINIKKDIVCGHSTFYFFMRCPVCGRIGTRKMYVDNEDALCQFGILYDVKLGFGIYMFDQNGKGRRIGDVTLKRDGDDNTRWLIRSYGVPEE